MGWYSRTEDIRSVQHVLKKHIVLDLHQRVVLRDGGGTGGVWTQRVPNLDSDVVRLICHNAGMRASATV